MMKSEFITIKEIREAQQMDMECAAEFLGIPEVIYSDIEEGRADYPRWCLDLIAEKLFSYDGYVRFVLLKATVRAATEELPYMNSDSVFEIDEDYIVVHQFTTYSAAVRAFEKCGAGLQIAEADGMATLSAFRLEIWKFNNNGLYQYTLKRLAESE